MKIYPGNESEKPILRKVIDELKQRGNVSGKTIQVADKGLNCINNILHALKAGDGYIFSKSVKGLPETEKLRGKRVATFHPKLAEKQIFEINRQVEKARILKVSRAKRSEFGDSAKYVLFVPDDKKGTKTDKKVTIEMNEKATENARKLAGYNLMVTSELSMSATDIYAAYHNLWRIEESFRIMKSQLDALLFHLKSKRQVAFAHCQDLDTKKGESYPISPFL